MDMEIKRMDVSCERAFYQTLLQDLPTSTLSQEVRAGRLPNVWATLHRKYRVEEDAAKLADAEPDGSTTSIAAGSKASPATHTHGGCD